MSEAEQQPAAVPESAPEAPQEVAAAVAVPAEGQDAASLAAYKTMMEAAAQGAFPGAAAFPMGFGQASVVDACLAPAGRAPAPLPAPR